MSEQDIELIRTAYETWARGDMDAFFALVDPEVEWHPPAYAPEPGPHVGIEAVKNGIGAYFDVFDEFRPEPKRIRETAQPGRYLAIVDTHTRGKGSGVEVTIEVGHLIDVSDGKLARLEVIPDLADAARAAGLEPESS